MANAAQALVGQTVQLTPGTYTFYTSFYPWVGGNSSVQVDSQTFTVLAVQGNWQIVSANQLWIQMQDSSTGNIWWWIYDGSSLEDSTGLPVVIAQSDIDAIVPGFAQGMLNSVVQLVPQQLQNAASDAGYDLEVIVLIALVLIVIAVLVFIWYKVKK